MAIDVSVSRYNLRRNRQRDFIVLTVFTVLIFFLFFLGSYIGLWQLLGACLVVTVVAVAFYVATAETWINGAATETAHQISWEVLLEGLPLPAMEVDKTSRILNYNASADHFLRADWSVKPRLSNLLRSPELASVIETVCSEDAVPPVSLELDGSPGEAWRVHVSRPRGEDNALVLMEDLAPVRRAARARSDFIANASHELRTPLTALSGFIETMRGPARDDKESWGRFLDIMAVESERMNRLISDLLSLSRIEFSEHAVPTDRIDLSALATKAVNAFSPMAAEQGITLVYESPNSPLPVIGNGDEMMQVLENLVSNAIKYSKAGGRVVVKAGQAPSFRQARVVSSQCRDDCEQRTLLMPTIRTGVDESAIWLRVEDDGAGIDKEHLPRLGERFYRADQSRGGKITGTGLGLAIVKHIMAHHRGGLGVESGVGRGSAFAIWLPRAPDK